MKTGKDSVVIGNVPPNSEVGEGSVVIGATDANGNTIINQPMAVGRGAKAGKNSISIGAYASAGIADTTNKTPEKRWHERSARHIVITILCGLVVTYLTYYFGWS